MSEHIFITMLSYFDCQIILFQGVTIDAKKDVYCERHIQFSCNGEQIVLKNIKAFGNLQKEILKCNGQEKCNVDNPEERCADLQYWCKNSK